MGRQIKVICGQIRRKWLWLEVWRHLYAYIVSGLGLRKLMPLISLHRGHSDFIILMHPWFVKLARPSHVMTLSAKLFHYFRSLSFLVWCYKFGYTCSFIVLCVLWSLWTLDHVTDDSVCGIVRCAVLPFARCKCYSFRRFCNLWFITHHLCGLHLQMTFKTLDNEKCLY